jgi:hypothetical protein
MCGGPSQAQQQQQQAQLTATNQNAALSKQLGDIFTSGEQATQPFYTSLLNQGLPYFNAQSQYSTSALAPQINQAQAAQKSKEAGYGGALPSGFADAASRDISTQGAEMFDQNQLSLLQQQEQAKMAGAAGLNPLAAGQTASQTNAGISAQQPLPNLNNNFWTNTIGGALTELFSRPAAVGA